MKILSKIKLSTVFIGLIFIVSIYLRLFNLGYSDYQGDEIKAFFNPKEDGDFLNFLITQRKGPLQFLVTGAVKGLSDNFQNYFVTRFPFALAGIGSVFVFYLLCKKYFSSRTAAWATIFFATNGILVAFSRIAQYQSFVIFFGLLSFYTFLVYKEKNKSYLLPLSFIFLAISILFHYDGVFFGIPTLMFILKDLIIDRKKLKKEYLRNLALAIILFLIVLASFYIPFVLNITEKTKEYWLGRISGDVSTKISSSYYLFTVYQPIYSAKIYLILTFLGLAVTFGIKKLKISFEYLSLLIWIGIPFAFMEGLVSIPGTHIYTYLIPSMILIGQGIDTIFTLTSKKWLIGIGDTVMLVLFIFLALQSNTIFLDHNKEYPWQEKKFLIFTLNKPTPIFHLSMFGFPYNRNWQEISTILKDTAPKYFTTNERAALTRFYLKNPKDNNKAEYFVYIENPQTFSNEITNKRIKEWTSINKPIWEKISLSGNKASIYEIPKEFESKNVNGNNLDNFDNNSDEN